ncbi:hypothetical protein ABT369_05400 [Dactylosporangium sp. NPDC000244]|uniref:hypothetical protein n=1 Tax=Dactylosporangium sp. NPDC000244 TaxID=3154365 RepID=UPI00331B186C
MSKNRDELEPSDLRHVHSAKVDARIAAAVAEAPPLPDDVAELLARLIRTAPRLERAGAAA